MGDLAANPTQWVHDDAGRARDEFPRAQRKGLKKTKPVSMIEFDNDSKLATNIDPEPESNRTLDVLA